MKIRVLILPVLLLSLIVGLPLSAQDEPVTMTFWVRGVSPLTATLVDEWNATHDNQIELSLIPAGDYITNLGAAIAAGESPDIVGIDLIYTPAFSAAGQLVDLTERAQELPFWDDLSPAHVTLGEFEGRNYALPFLADGSFLVYNVDLFTE